MAPAEKSSDVIDSKAVKSLVEAKGIRGATVLGRPGGWAVLVRYGEAERAVAGQKSHRMRLWRRVDSAIGFVRSELGMDRFDVDATHYHVNPAERRRPDTVERLRRQREAVAHDRWFRAEVQSAIDGIAAGTNPIASDDEVERRLKTLRNALKSAAS
ncbi:hypothetical protein [Labrys miyagiensis]|nr:hypothetical protein [Labrys miyagiensis]